MMEKPSLKLCGLSLWFRRPHPAALSDLGLDFFNVTARMEASGAYVECLQQILLTSTLRRFRDDLKMMHNTFDGDAALASLEPGFSLIIGLRNRGHTEVVVEITPDHLTQGHHFVAGADQSYLPGLIADCENILVDAVVR